MEEMKHSDTHTQTFNENLLLIANAKTDFINFQWNQNYMS